MVPPCHIQCVFTGSDQIYHGQQKKKAVCEKHLVPISCTAVLWQIFPSLGTKSPLQVLLLYKLKMVARGGVAEVSVLGWCVRLALKGV